MSFGPRQPLQISKYQMLGLYRRKDFNHHYAFYMTTSGHCWKQNAGFAGSLLCPIKPFLCSYVLQISICMLETCRISDCVQGVSAHKCLFFHNLRCPDKTRRQVCYSAILEQSYTPLNLLKAWKGVTLYRMQSVAASFVALKKKCYATIK